MFFVLSKVFWVVARPLNFLLMLALAGLLARALGWKRTGGAALVTSIMLLGVVGFTQSTDWLLRELEYATAPVEMPAEPAGIIVLGGGLAPGGPGGLSFHINDAGDRLIRGLELKRLHPQARLIYTGGSAALMADEPAEAGGALAMVRALYGDDRGIELEGASRNTWENAVEVAKMIGDDRDKPWLLVTSAFHMPRSLGCFRQAGVNVVPVKTDYRADPLVFPWLTPEAPNQFLKASLLFKEIVGLVAYRLTGKTDALLPR